MLIDMLKHNPTIIDTTLKESNGKIYVSGRLVKYDLDINIPFVYAEAEDFAFDRMQGGYGLSGIKFKGYDKFTNTYGVNIDDEETYKIIMRLLDEKIGKESEEEY